MSVHVLLFDAGSEQEGIHSLELNGRTVVLLFENRDDAERYAGLLEAQDFPVPTVEALDRTEMEQFCSQSGYEARFVPAGFVPQSPEERLLIAPPERNMDVSHWQEEEQEVHAGVDGRGQAGPEQPAEPISSGDPELEAFRRQLEGLL
ncbi:DUF3110 domain-containing protein [Cyanobium sp. CH-040]|uniref:DUF3110 domain-containing protein n=1 Tax=Cyanobium sp. CH-040 TaxID=2823708 RepID=UPI0020CD7ED4|nr:DUF3110 domain-containing protein [Cyanobium sp. CH-040]MCP9928782.1 DUF3110 domain-containing protein [Cyanobium sp. CH-040]